MSHDLQMARGAVDGETNLAIGEPFFLQNILADEIRVRYTSKRLTYPHIGGEPELIEELHRLLPQYKYIVVTNGAKQAIEATFFALKRLERRSVVLHRAPYWPSYPTLAKSQGLDFNVAAPRPASIACITSPNNPDGSQNWLAQDIYDLWDGAYAQPLYGYHGIPPMHRVAVFSAAKNLGLSGLRVGWVATDEPEIAAQAAYFVEITTSGVSIPSQMHMVGCLRALRDPDQIGHLTRAGFEARAALMTNGASFNELISDFTADVAGVPTAGQGMFAWFRARRPEIFATALEVAKIKLVTGEACGEHRRGWYRMSMGQMPEVTRDALIKLRITYYKQRGS
jgi:aspartate/methionine/tyrosine aminotransferase